MSELASVGHELAWEVRRLTGDEPEHPELAEILDFGDTPWLGYKVRPWGLVGVQFNSEYLYIHGQPVLANEDEDAIMANIIVESRYRSVIATGSILCDRVLYEIHADGNVEATLSRGELTAALEVDFDYFDEDESGRDLSADIFWLDEPLTETPLQEANNRRLDDLTELQALLPDDDLRVEAIQHEINRIDNSGEEDVAMAFSVTVDGLRELLAQLKLVEDEDRLGRISAISIVDNYISPA